jgi:hypothetical protein
MKKIVQVEVFVVVSMRFVLTAFSVLFVIFRVRRSVMEDRKEGKIVAVHNGISFSFMSWCMCGRERHQECDQKNRIHQSMV